MKSIIKFVTCAFLLSCISGQTSAMDRPVVRSAICEAIESGDAKKVKKLIRKNKGLVKKKFGKGTTILMLAAGHQNVEILKLLLDAGSDINAQDDSQLTALHDAIYYGQFDCAKELIVRGANPNVIHKAHRRSILMLAVSKKSLRMVELLIEGGVDVNHQSDRGTTALNLAAKKGHLAIAKKLIDAGADVDRATFKEWTPLMVATRQGHGEMIKLLLDNGANQNLQNIDGEIAIDVALQYGHEDLLGSDGKECLFDFPLDLMWPTDSMMPREDCVQEK